MSVLVYLADFMTFDEDIHQKKGERFEMREYHIGKAILELRQHFNISQRALAKDLCDQSLISRIEKNEIYPSAPLLYELAKRFGVDINYFFTNNHSPISTIDYGDEFCRQIRQLVHDRKHQEAYRMIKKEEKNPLFRKIELSRFLWWMKGVCIFYLEKDLEEAVRCINEALLIHQTTKKNYCEEEIEILISKAVFYSEVQKYDKATEVFLEALYHFRRLPFHGNLKIEMRLYYNISKSYFQQKKFKQSIEYSDKGIYQAIEKQQFYSLGHLYFQKGECYLYLDDFVASVGYMKEALWIFDKTKQSSLYNYVLQELKKVETNQHPKDFSDVT